jgi:hypothetical protein
MAPWMILRGITQMRMVPLVCAAGLALCGAVHLSPSAHAALVLDQEYLLNNAFAEFSNGMGFRRAETFTVGVAGILSEVDIFTDVTATFTGFNILSTSAGVPTTTVVAVGTLSSQSGGEAAFSVSLPVSIGEVLAIEPMTPAGTPGLWLAEDPGSYPGGGDFFINPVFGIDSFTPSGFADDFRTFVGVPEPGTLACLGAGLVLLLGRRRDQHDARLFNVD